ncbi:tRNA threonylcarbamoyladenosine dehydratase [Geoalkalibacter subterraneus]|uniref:Thiamine biosynthesis protein ThiF n=1 Tax=Geoalkalibacter subterraneus TaxID=483547 RepID=A0A0B5FU62_9BACT|nr:tRNA threonylcarbamoyladenosine dehydratase [Geoalkalibacter subterraneus]AJF07715.1 thiamine biosynthesis protein ThiF [Geoalkalibacter subterraneus]
MDELTTQPRFDRLQRLVGHKGLETLAAARVAVFGLGGVGSYAAEALARGGVGQLTLVDFDTIHPSNINRQLHALDDTIGRPKALEMAERCRKINPEAEIIPVQEFFLEKNSEQLLEPHYDYVLDCIDHISAKLHLIEECKRRKLPIISSMGAANKLDPTCIHVADLFKTHNCRLARIIRKNLRRRGIESGVPVVYSTEEFRPLQAGRTAVAAADEEPAGYQDLRAPLGSSSYIPPLFGLTMAGEVIRTLLGEQN